MDKLGPETLREPLPWYAKFALGLLATALSLGFLYLGRDLLVPIAYAALLSVLLHPISDFFERHGLPRFLSILIAVTTACMAVLGLVAIIAMQIGQFADELPRIREQGGEFVTRIQSVIKEYLGITYKDQLRWFQEWWSQTWQKGGEALSQTFLTFMDITSLVVLVPLYAFLMLYYKNHLINFLSQVSGKKSKGILRDALEAARSVVRGYVVGLLIEAFIIAVLNSVALLLLGIDYAILFGILSALLNLIPYIGTLIASLLPMLMAVITKDSLWYPVGVAATFGFIQVIDNNILVPYIVASRVSINALSSVIAVIIGGMLWGVSGMFLSLPAVAIIKVVCDRVENLKPLGLILGTEISPEVPVKSIRPS